MGPWLLIAESFRRRDGDGVARGQQAVGEGAESQERGGGEQTAHSKSVRHP